jgi:hypothetical protein
MSSIKGFSFKFYEMREIMKIKPGNNMARDSRPVQTLTETSIMLLLLDQKFQAALTDVILHFT